jgi:hypothetical protein
VGIVETVLTVFWLFMVAVLIVATVVSLILALSTLWELLWPR